MGKLRSRRAEDVPEMEQVEAGSKASSEVGPNVAHVGHHFHGPVKGGAE